MTTPIRLDSLTFSDGTEVPVCKDSIVVLVGPNNSGKSRALREIREYLTAGREPKVVTAATLTKLADVEGVKQWLRQHAHVYWEDNTEKMMRPLAGQTNFAVVDHLWIQGPPLANIGSFFVMLADTQSRLNLAASVEAIDTLTQVPSAPLHELFIDGDLEAQLADAAERAFGKRLIVNRVAGSRIHLHVGSVDVAGLPIGTNKAYAEALQALPVVQEEGDGVRSYVGLLLAVTATQYPLVLVDEPEAFLHPPQASQLGRELATLRDEDTQLVVATHSSHLLQGLLDTQGANVTVVRLTRDGSKNVASVLGREQLRTLWSDPILRYSALLDGLFHRGVVLCESDSDCRFYQATLEAVLLRDGKPAHDLLFTHTGGKDRLPIAITALRAINVEVQVVADFDVLAREALIKQLVEGLGGTWSEIEHDWKVVCGAINQLGSATPMTAVRADLEQALAAITDANLTREAAKRLRGIVKLEDGWSRAKQGGLSVLPQGEASESGKRLVAVLGAMGLYVVPVGELERWAPGVAGHGPQWTAGALEAKIHEQSGSHAEFVGQLVDFRVAVETSVSSAPNVSPGS
jgi:hypothetical protein